MEIMTFIIIILCVLGKIEQYSQDPRDLGTMVLEEYTRAMGDIYESLLPLVKPKGYCVINVPNILLK